MFQKPFDHTVAKQTCHVQRSAWYIESLGNLNNRAGADFPLPGHFDLNATLLGCPN